MGEEYVETGVDELVQRIDALEHRVEQNSANLVLIQHQIDKLQEQIDKLVGLLEHLADVTD